MLSATKFTSPRNNCPKIQEPCELLLWASQGLAILGNKCHLFCHLPGGTWLSCCSLPTAFPSCSHKQSSRAAGTSPNKPLASLEAWAHGLPDTRQLLCECMCPHSPTRHKAARKNHSEASDTLIQAEHLSIHPGAADRVPSQLSHSSWILVSPAPLQELWEDHALGESVAWHIYGRERVVEKEGGENGTREEAGTTASLQPLVQTRKWGGKQ